MTSKLPLVTVAIIIVAVAAVGAWEIFANTTVTTPSGVATITATVAPGTVFGAAPAKSGIENIYIVTTGTAINANLSGSANILGVITSSGGSATIASGTAFDIVIAYKAHGDNLGWIRLDNSKIQWQVSGAYTVGAATEITDANEARFDNNAPENTAAKGTSYYQRVNARGASNWNLGAGQSISLDNVSLWIWG